jgi:peptidyl-prolyl cis-trans isomerase C
VLAELILSRRVEKRLAEKGVKLSDEQVAAERALLLKNLSRDENTAVRLLRELRQRRGLGDARFEQLLRRNAGLRLLIQDDVHLTDAAIQQAFDIENGRRYEARLITVDTLQKAGEVIRRAKAGESFIDLAVNFSTDPSRQQGGLLPPLSPADPTWPDGVRKMLVTMTPGQISDPVAIERGFAVLRLERTLEPTGKKLEEVKDELAGRVRRSAERVLMQRLARHLLNDADLLVTDRALRESWAVQKELMVE